MQNLLYKMFDASISVNAVLRHMVGYYLAVSQRIFEEAAGLIDILFMR